MSVEALSGKVFLIVSGASQGIGRQIALSFSGVLAQGSHVLLLARNKNALEETAKNIPSGIKVNCVSVDLGETDKDKLEVIVQGCLKSSALESFDRVVVVHNVGSVGDLSVKTKDMTDINTWQKYFALNVYIPAILNGVIMHIFDDKTSTKKIVINITSLMAIQPEKTFGYYCTGKAAREMFFKVFALENPHINVLNYSPGPVYTEMLNEVCRTAGDKDVKDKFTDLCSKRAALTPEQTINRLLQVLEKQKYKSGDHVDYYDEL